MKRSGIALGLVGALAAGCSLLLNQNADQCSTDKDCAPFAGTYCDLARHVCRAAVSYSDGGDAAPSGCKGNASCTAGVCIQGTCQQVSTADCQQVFGEGHLADDSVRLIGVLTPLSGSDAVRGLDVQRAVQAAYELYDSNGPGVFGELQPTAVVVCDEDASGLSEDLDHLKTIGVKTIVGPIKNSSVLTVVPDIESRSMTMIAPFADEPSFEATGGVVAKALGHGSYVSLHPNLSREFPAAFPAALNKAESLLKAADPQQFASFSIAVLSDPKDSPGSVQVSTQLKKTLSSATYLQYQGSGTEQALVSALKGITPLPNLIVTATGEDIWSAPLRAIKGGWPSGQPMPWFFMPGRSDAVAKDIALKSVPAQIIGFNIERPSDSQPIYSQFASQYQQDFTGDPPWGLDYVFDATLVAIYANLGAESLAKPGAFSPADFQGFLKTLLLSPPPVPQSLLNFNVMNAAINFPTTDSVNAVGASGELDVDFSVGSPTANYEMFCFPTTQGAVDYCDMGLSIDQKTGTVSGTLNKCSCP